MEVIMKISRILLVMFVTICLVLMGTTAFAAKKKAGPYNFLFVPGETDPFYFSIAKGAKEKAKELGVNLTITEYPKAWGPEVQTPIMDAAVAMGDIDLVIVAPTSNDAMIAPLKRVYDMGIEIITVDTYIGDGDYSKKSEFSFPLAYSGTDNKLGGIRVAEKMAELSGAKGKFYCNSTSPDVSSNNDRYLGFKEGLSKYPGMEFVGVDYNLEQQQRAQQQVFTKLQSIPDLRGVFGTNIWSAQGAYQAVVNAGKREQLIIAAWDASDDLINALKAGKVDFILAQKPAEMGALAVEWGYKFFKEGAEVPKNQTPGFEFFTSENVNDPAMQKWIYGH